MPLPKAALYAALFLALDSAVAINPNWRGGILSNIFQILAPSLALAACWWRARRAPAHARLLWILLRVSLILWILATVFSIWEDFIHVPFDTPAYSDFIFFYYGIPILFAVSTPVDGPRIHWFVWLDGLQAAFAGYLAYAAIFSSLPFLIGHHLSAARMVGVYNVENAVLTVACAFRMFTCPRWSDEWRFFRMLGIFLIVYAIGIGLYNHYAVILPGHHPPDLLANAPFLVLAVHALTLPWKRRPEQETPRRFRAELFIDNASPIFFTLALLTLGLIALRIHFITGIIAISLALITYAIRTTVLQTRYLEVQGELQEARDRLEAISLKDSLTGVANRRCFDQTLAHEWHRAARTAQPLALIFIDIDLFKELNDTQGHQAGDRCLTQVATILHSLAKRSGDLVSRYGGEEFATILAGATEEEALAMAERMRIGILALHIPNPTRISSWLTASIGVASCIPTINGESATLLAAADRALYRAKGQGRNRVEVEAMAIPPGLLDYSV